MKSQRLKTAVSQMPPLSHWPDKHIPFSYGGSDVVKWLTANPEVQRWLFDAVRSAGLIVYDESEQTWKGNITAQD